MKNNSIFFVIVSTVSIVAMEPDQQVHEIYFQNDILGSLAHTFLSKQKPSFQEVFKKYDTDKKVATELDHYLDELFKSMYPPYEAADDFKEFELHFETILVGCTHSLSKLCIYHRYDSYSNDSKPIIKLVPFSYQRMRSILALSETFSHFCTPNDFMINQVLLQFREQQKQKALHTLMEARHNLKEE